MKLPADVADRPFTRAEALAAGLTPKQLRSVRWRRLLRGVYVNADLVLTVVVWARAALLAAPRGAVISHYTALALWGLDVPSDGRIHVSTRTNWDSEQARIASHRRQGSIASRERHGLPVTSPERTFVDLATKLSWPWLVVTGDWLITQRFTTLQRLVEYADDRHLSGVRRARRALRWVREGAESPRESWVRLLLVTARFPEPELQVRVLDGDGHFIARVDMAYVRWQVAVEYDGYWHERSARQRERDRDRRECLERLGWTVIVIYDTDLSDPRKIPWRIFHALREQGYLGPAPVTSVMWERWFAASNFRRAMAPRAAA
ncbi:hypothetical protein BHE97_12870 [Aeromicrobium sp. PE09-221]|uniref:DUF559 domain-containing protein n=1 Tax=Aeromicrobium sp. PE09-221 TaxID=1898043 RepID=UPI000B3EB861|nr:DUF559 domain-containing protein [Aeromicrobium sp. PE09-221]OUZ08566.1 hypothetical protein BHE97_12870 [Aeromicrobium sp. PE09-221]